MSQDELAGWHFLRRVGNTTPATNDNQIKIKKYTARDFLQKEFIITEESSIEVYDKLKHFHYISDSVPSIRRKIYALRQRNTKIVYGVILYGVPSLQVTPRKYTPLGRILKENYPDKRTRSIALNRLCTYVKRIIIHPSIRGIGAAPYLFEETWRKVGTRFVERFSTMLYYTNFLPEGYYCYYKVKKVLSPSEFFHKPNNKEALYKRVQSPVVGYGYALYINSDVK